MKVITDTCSAIKLLAFGTKFFTKGLLPTGDLVLHSRVFRETKQWHPEKKSKYTKELTHLKKISSTPGLTPPPKQRKSQEGIIRMVIDQYALSVGAGDIEQLASVLHFGFKLVTNDDHFADTAKILEVETFEAEEILIEAHDHHVVTKKEARDALRIWKQRGEKRPSTVSHKELKKRRLI